MKKKDIIDMYAAMHGVDVKEVELKEQSPGNGVSTFMWTLWCTNSSMPSNTLVAIEKTEGKTREALGALVREEASKRFDKLYVFFGQHGSRRGA
jgi:hypothetical protein